MNYGGNIGDWHHYTPPQVEEGTSAAQNVNSGHLAFIPNLSPPNLNSINFNSETLEKHQNDPNFNPKHFQPLNNISNGSSNSNVAPLASMVQMQNSIGHYGPSNTRNPVLNHMNGTMDARGSSINTMNDELGYRNNPVPSNGPISHLSGPNCNVNPPPGGVGPRNANVSSMPSGRPSVHSYIPCKGLCCNPESSINYQQWEKFGAYQNTTPYRDNVRLPGYEMDNRQYASNLNYRKEGFENKDVMGHVLPNTANTDHRRNFPDYKNHKDHIVPRNYSSSSGMFQNYPVQNYNYVGEYQKFQYSNKEYPKMANVSAQHVEQNFLPQQRYNNKQIQYQNGSLVPKTAPTTNVNSNVGATVQNPYFSTQFPRTVPTEMPRSCQESSVADNSAMFNRAQSTQAHPTHARHQAYQQKIAMQRFSIESHLRELTRIPGYQSHPKYRECLLRYREVLKLQQFAGYQNQVQQYSRIATSTSATTVSPINLQFDQNGVLINSNFTLNGFPKVQVAQGTDLNIENSEKQIKCNNVNQSENKTPEAQQTEQLLAQPCNESIAPMSTQNFQKQSQFQTQIEHNSNQFKGQKLPCESERKSNASNTMNNAPQQESSKVISDKPNLDVRQFLANWDEMDDEDGTNAPDVVLNNSTPVVVVSYEDVTLATKDTVNSEPLKQNGFCTNQAGFESQTKDTLGVLVTPNLSQTITKPDTVQENVVKPGSIIHCISNGADEIPTIHIVNNLEIGNILEVSDEQIVGTFDGQKAISFFEQAETRTNEVDGFTEGTSSTSPEQTVTTETTEHSPESVKSAEAQSNDGQLQATSSTTAPSSEENVNLKKQNSFTSEESHNPDDISLPDLPTSECTPISTTLNTPIHSDSEESTERTEDLTISANPIEVMQNSPVISFTQSPIKVDPYEHLNSDESAKGSPLEELRLDFQCDVQGKSNDETEDEGQAIAPSNVKLIQEGKEIEGRKVYKQGKNQIDNTASLCDVRDILTSNKYREHKTVEGYSNLATVSYQKQESVQCSLAEKSAVIVESINVENQKDAKKKCSLPDNNPIVNTRKSENISPINLSGPAMPKNLPTSVSKSSKEHSSNSLTNRKVCEKRATILQNTIVSAGTSKRSSSKLLKINTPTTYSEFPYKEMKNREISDVVNVEKDVHDLTGESRVAKIQRKGSCKELKHDSEGRKRKNIKNDAHSTERKDFWMPQAHKKSPKFTVPKDSLVVSNKDLQSTIEKCLETIVQQNKYTHNFCCEKSHVKSQKDPKGCRASQDIGGIFDPTEVRHACRESKEKTDHSQNIGRSNSKLRLDRMVKDDGWLKSTKAPDKTIVDPVRTIVDKNHKDDSHKCKAIDRQYAELNGDVEGQTEQNFCAIDSYHGEKARSYSRNFVSKNANSDFAVQVTNVNLKIKDGDKEDHCTEPTKDSLDGFKIEINVSRTEKNTREISTDRASTSFQDLSRDHSMVLDKAEDKLEKDLKEFDTERNTTALCRVPRRRSSFPLEERSMRSTDGLPKTDKTEVRRLARAGLDLEKLCTISPCSSDTEKSSRLSVENLNASLGLLDKRSYHTSTLISCNSGKNLEEGVSRIRNTVDYKSCVSNRASNSSSPADLSYDRFILSKMDEKEISWSEKWRKLKTGRRHEDRKQYSDGSGYMNPIFVNIEESQDLCRVPVYTTRDGKISYSPNPNYRALTMESLERSESSLSSLRRSYYNSKSITDYCNYLKLQKFLKKRNNSGKEDNKEQEIKRSRLFHESLNDHWNARTEKDSTNQKCQVKNGDNLDGAVELVELESRANIQQHEEKKLNHDEDKLASETMSCIIQSNCENLDLQDADKNGNNNVQWEQGMESYEDNIKDRNFNDILDNQKKKDSQILSQENSFNPSNCTSSSISTPKVDDSRNLDQGCNEIVPCEEIEVSDINEDIPSTINQNTESENSPKDIVSDTKKQLEETKKVLEIQESGKNQDKIIIESLQIYEGPECIEKECKEISKMNENDVVSDKIGMAKVQSPSINLTVLNEQIEKQIVTNSNGSTNHEKCSLIVPIKLDESEAVNFEEAQEDLPQKYINEQDFSSDEKDKNSLLEATENKPPREEIALNEGKHKLVPTKADNISQSAVDICTLNEDNISEKSIVSISTSNTSPKHEVEHCNTSNDGEVVPLTSSLYIDTENIPKSPEELPSSVENLCNTETAKSITRDQSVEPSVCTDTKLEDIEETPTISSQINNNDICVETVPSIVPLTNKKSILEETKPQYTIEEIPRLHCEDHQANRENPRATSKDTIDPDRSESQATKPSCTSKRKGQYHLSSGDTYKTSHVFDSDTNSKTVPKLIIKKSERKSVHGQRSESANANDRVLSSRGYATHPRIPKMIIRNSRSRSLTPSSQEDSKHAEETGFGRESSPRCNFDSVEFDSYRSEVSISLTDDDGSARFFVKRKNAKNTIPKMTIKKIKVESTEAYNASNAAAECRDFDDHFETDGTSDSPSGHNDKPPRLSRIDVEERAEKIPKLTLRRREVEKSAESSIEEADLVRPRKRSCGEESPRYEGSSKEPRISKNSLMSISGKIPKVIIKRSSTSAEFKCELSKERKNSIVQKDEWQPKVQLQRSPVLDRMAEELKTSRLTTYIGKTRFQNVNRNKKDRRHREVSLCRSSSTSDLSATKRKQRRMSDYDYGKATEPELSRNDLRNAHLHHRNSKDESNIEKRTTSIKKHSEQHEERSDFIDEIRGNSDSLDSRADGKNIDPPTLQEETKNITVNLNDSVPSLYRCTNSLNDTVKSPENVPQNIFDLQDEDTFEKIVEYPEQNNKVVDLPKDVVDSTNAMDIPDFLTNEHIDDRIAVKEECMSISDNELDDLENPRSKPILNVSSRSFDDDNSVIKVDSSDESQTTIEILPASPDVNPTEIGISSCIFDGIEGERLYTEDAIPAQLEFELGITDSNIDSSDVFMPGMECSSPSYMFPDKSNEVSNEKLLDSFTGEFQDFSEFNFRQNSVDDCERELDLSFPAYEAKEQEEMYREIRRNSIGSISRGDTLEKEILAAKETLRMCLVKPDREANSRCRPKTAAEKKQGLGFDLHELSRTISGSPVQQQATSPKSQKNVISKTENENTWSRKRSKQVLRIADETRLEANTKEEPSIADGSTTISLKAFKRFDAAMRKNDDATSRVSVNQSNQAEKCIVRTQCKDNCKDSWTLSVADRRTNHEINEKVSKTKEENMPILVPEVSLNFEQNSDRDSSRSPPVITSLETAEVKDVEEEVISVTPKKPLETKSETSIADIVTQLAYHEKSTIKHRRYCNLCERWFPTTSRHRRHLAGYQHRHIELTQRRSIHALFILFTGKPCPRLLPATIVRNDCSIGELTPLQLAVQDVAKCWETAGEKEKE